MQSIPIKYHPITTQPETIQIEINPQEAIQKKHNLNKQCVFKGISVQRFVDDPKVGEPAIKALFISSAISSATFKLMGCSKFISCCGGISTGIASGIFCCIATQCIQNQIDS